MIRRRHSDWSLGVQNNRDTRHIYILRSQGVSLENYLLLLARTSKYTSGSIGLQARIQSLVFMFSKFHMLRPHFDKILCGCKIVGCLSSSYNETWT